MSRPGLSDQFETAAFILLVALSVGATLSESEWLLVGKIAGGVALTTVLPGYAISKLLFPGHTGLSAAERFAVNFASSIAVTGLLVYILSATSLPIGRISVALGLGGISILLASIAHLRAARLPHRDRFTAFRAQRSARATVAVSGVMIAFCAVFATAVLDTEGVTETTAFYIAGDAGRLNGYPRSWGPGETVELTVGVTNHESSATRFMIASQGDSGGDPLIDTPSLEPGQTWERSLEITTPDRSDERIVFGLYRAGIDSEPYRTLHLTPSELP